MSDLAGYDPLTPGGWQYRGPGRYEHPMHGRAELDGREWFRISLAGFRHGPYPTCGDAFDDAAGMTACRVQAERLADKECLKRLDARKRRDRAEMGKGDKLVLAALSVMAAGFRGDAAIERLMERTGCELADATRAVRRARGIRAQRRNQIQRDCLGDP